MINAARPDPIAESAAPLLYSLRADRGGWHPRSTI